MQLPPELCEQIVGALNATPPEDGQAAHDDDQRRQPRTGAAGVAVTLIPLTDRVFGGQPFDVTLRDFSAGGVGFFHRYKIDLGEPFVILLPQGECPLAVMCEVAYYQPLRADLFAIGAKFTRVLRESGTRDTNLALETPAAINSRRAAS